MDMNHARALNGATVLVVENAHALEVVAVVLGWMVAAATCAWMVPKKITEKLREWLRE